jgi:hypothetical protein
VQINNMEKSNYFSYVRATKKNGAAKQISKHTMDLVKKKKGLAEHRFTQISVMTRFVKRNTDHSVQASC